MAKRKSLIQNRSNQLKKLDFLIGKWHTEGEILKTAAGSPGKIRGMDTYEWVSGNAFLLHKVDVFMGKTRTEIIEIIGYDKDSGSFSMQSFDNLGASVTMNASVIKTGVMKIKGENMRSTLILHKNNNYMVAKWELSVDGKTWLPWMKIRLAR